MNTEELEAIRERLAKAGRYDPDMQYIGTGEYVPVMTLAVDGDYVEYVEYARLLARVDELTRREQEAIVAERAAQNRIRELERELDEAKKRAEGAELVRADLEKRFDEAECRGRIAGLNEAREIARKYRDARAIGDTRHVRDERGMGAWRVYERIGFRIQEFEQEWKETLRANERQSLELETLLARVDELTRRIESTPPWPRDEEALDDEQMRALRMRWSTGPERYQADADALIATAHLAVRREQESVLREREANERVRELTAGRDKLAHLLTQCVQVLTEVRPTAALAVIVDEANLALSIHGRESPSYEQLRTELEAVKAKRDEDRATLRAIAHELGRCHCWDYGCEPADCATLIERATELRNAETERDKAIDMERTMASGARIAAESYASLRSRHEAQGVVLADVERQLAETRAALASTSGVTVHVSAEDAAGWVRAEMSFVFVEPDDKQAWERVDSAIRAAMQHAALSAAAERSGA